MSFVCIAGGRDHLFVATDTRTTAVMESGATHYSDADAKLLQTGDGASFGWAAASGAVRLINPAMNALERTTMHPLTVKAAIVAAQSEIEPGVLKRLYEAQPVNELYVAGCIDGNIWGGVYNERGEPRHERNRLVIVRAPGGISDELAAQMQLACGQELAASRHSIDEQIEVAVKWLGKFADVTPWVSRTLHIGLLRNTPAGVVSERITKEVATVATTLCGGGNLESIILELDDNSDFSSIRESSPALALTDGGSAQWTSSALALTDRGKQWYVRCRPFNRPSGLGLEGSAAVASVFVEGNVSKKLRIAGTAFVPDPATSSFISFTASGIKHTGIGTSYAYAAVVLPVGTGVTINALSVRGASVNGTNQAALLRQGDATQTSIATASYVDDSVENTGTTSGLTESTASRAHLIKLTLTGSNSTGGAHVQYVEIDYTMGEPRAAL